MDTGDDAASEAIKQAQGVLRALVQEIRRRAWMGGVNVDKGKVAKDGDNFLSRLFANEASEIKLTPKYEGAVKDATMPHTAQDVLRGRTFYCDTFAQRDALEKTLMEHGIQPYSDPAYADERIQKLEPGATPRGLLPEKETGAYRVWTDAPIGEWADKELAREVNSAYGHKAFTRNLALRKAEAELSAKAPKAPVEFAKGAWANPTFTVKTLSFDQQASFWDEHLAERGVPFAKTVMDGAVRYEIAPESARDMQAMLDDLEGITNNRRDDGRVSVDAAFKEALDPAAEHESVREMSRFSVPHDDDLQAVANMEVLNELGIDYDVAFDSELNVDTFVVDTDAAQSLMDLDDAQLGAAYQSENVVTSVNQAAAAVKKGQKAATASHSASKPMKERQFKLHAAEDLGREQTREHARQDQARAQRLARESRDRGARPERSETRAR